MQKNSVIIIVLITLVLSLGVGYSLGASNTATPVVSQNTRGMHRMPDGSMMSNQADMMSMADMMSSMNAELEGKTGDDFDNAFITEMIVHHQGAVEMARLALTNAKHQEIKDLANAIITAQNKEIADMRAWQKAWYNR